MITGTLARNRRLAKRRSPKNGTQVVCQKGSYGLGANLAVKVLDVSEAGIRLIVKAPLERGQEFTVGLSIPGKGRPLKALARAIWCVETADGDFCVGGHFHKRLAYLDLVGLVSQTEV